MWYPAAASSGETMQFGEYLDVKSPDPALAAFTTRLAKFTRDTVIDDLYEFPPSALHNEEKRNFDRLLKTTVHARRNATPLAGKFPLEPVELTKRILSFSNTSRATATS